MMDEDQQGERIRVPVLGSGSDLSVCRDVARRSSVGTDILGVFDFRYLPGLAGWPCNGWPESG